MKKGLIIVFLLSLLLSIVRAQEGAPAQTTTTASPVTNGIETCLEISKCGDDQACRAKCAGVPNPTEQQVNDTRTCIENCTPTDPNYAVCRDSCIDTYYNPKPTFTSSTIPPSTTPSSASTASASTSTASSTQNEPKMPTPISSVAVNATPFSTLLLAFIIFISVSFSLDN